LIPRRDTCLFGAIALAGFFDIAVAHSLRGAAASTIALMPALMAAGSVGQAATTAAKSGIFSAKSAKQSAESFCRSSQRIMLSPVASPSRRFPKP
jgi:hypothetical protein